MQILGKGMITQLHTPIPIITTKGKALAHFLIDEGAESNLKWVCFLDKNGECWTFQNPDIRARKNITEGRENISPFYDPDDVAFITKSIELSKEDTELFLQALETGSNVDLLSIKQWLEMRCKNL